ncbi:tetratricopeptide repeat-containing protein [Mycena crocata]|nr:tetratricopeptide repeat-containing protein [Mycena crocata]
MAKKLDEAVAICEHNLARCPKWQSRRDCLTNLADALRDRFQLSGTTTDIDLAIQYQRQAFGLCRKWDSEYSPVVGNLSALLYSRFNQLRRIEDLEEAIDAGRKSLARCPGGHRYHLTALSNLAGFIYERFQQRSSGEDLDEAIHLYREALALRPVPHPDRVSFLRSLATVIHARFEHREDLEDLDEAVRLHREVLALHRAPHPERASHLSTLATAIDTRFERRGIAADIDEVIALHREALELRPGSDPDHADSVSNLATAISMRLDRLGAAEDSDKIIHLQREALALRPPGHPDRVVSLNNLAIAIRRRFEQQGEAEDLDKIVQLHREALALQPAPSPERATCLSNLAAAIHTRFEHRGGSEDIDEAVSLHREALTLRPAPHPDRAISLGNLATIIGTRFQQRGSTNDIDEAIQLHREALTLRLAPHPHRASSLHNLAIAINRRLRRGLETVEDIDEIIKLHLEAVALCPPQHPERDTYLSNLASTIQTRFGQRGVAEDIDEAIHIQREALALRPESHPNRAKSLSSLGTAMSARFEQRGAAEDIDAAIHFHREALALRPEPHPERAGSLNSVGSALSMRFEQRGAAEDIDEAIHLHREALALLPELHPDRASSLNSLGGAIHARFADRGAADDIDEAIRVHREALARCPPAHPSRRSFLSNLATDFYTRFEHGGPASDIDEAVLHHREALALCALADPDRASYVSNLASAISKRFEKLRAVEDIKEAIPLQREALSLRPEPLPDRISSLRNLGLVLLSQPHPNVDEAMLTFEEGSIYVSGSPLTRFHMAQLWARTASENHHGSALRAYQRAIELLPQLAAVSLDLKSRQKMLVSRSDNLGSDAAACAIGLGKHELALELLEAGRSVLWSQSLHLRTSLDDLEISRPKLATKLAELSLELERKSFRDTSRDFKIDNQQKAISLEEEGLKCRELNSEWIRTLEEVRLITGFEDFLRPKSMSRLRLAAARGPVVVLNAGDESCHALIVHLSREVECIPLPELRSRQFVKILAEMVQAITSSSSMFNALLEKLANRTIEADSVDRLFGRIVYRQHQSPDECFRTVLKILWSGIIIPVIQESSLKYQKSDNRPRLWWCPTGPFAFLPIHAAGLYDSASPICSVADYVVSSYTPTLTALLFPNHPRFGPNRLPKTTAVAQPTTPMFASLPGTILELRRIEEKVPKKWVTILESPTSVDTVLQHLHSSSIIHFACHGVQDTDQPLRSALLVGGHQLTVSQIMERSGGSHNGPTPRDMGLAFLSACQTAAGDQNLPDESLHLAATLLFAGYRSVVATMWTMTDSDGPKITEEFYGHLFRNADPKSEPPVFPDLNDSAEALHLAVGKLIGKVPLLQWIPFVHYGV